MSCLGLLVNVAFYFAKLPEVAQVVAHDAQQTVSVKGFMKKTHTIAGFFAEFGYVSRCRLRRGATFQTDASYTICTGRRTR
jgi:hypothetical protein